MALGVGTAMLLGSLAAPLIGQGTSALFDWMGLGPDKPKQPKMPGQAVPDTKPPLVVPEAPQSQFVPPQMGGGGRGPGPGGPSNDEVLSRALRQWMGR